ncbi:MAG: hypothetical protein K0B37_02825 [Bacteroidales bacterium]|nr:hypothetical protein [Bacteroidales bacterium]
MLFFSAFFLLLIPLLISSGLGGFAGSVGLYFHTFEFNSGILSLFRQTAMMISGWDLVFLFGPLLALLTLVLLIALYITRNNEDPFIAIETMLFSLTVYYLLTSTVHPWYISTILIISLFTRFRYPVLWSFLVFLSYFTYRSEAFAESNVILITEYFLLYTFISFELFWKGRRENVSGLRTMHDKNIKHGNVSSETRIDRQHREYDK